MRMTPRIAGRLGRVGFRSISPRIAPGDPPLPEDCHVFPGSIAEKTYKFTPTHGHILIVGFFGRRMTSGAVLDVTATYNGLPMVVSYPAGTGSGFGAPGFAYIEGVEPGIEGEVIFTVNSGAIETGALKFLDPPEYTPLPDNEEQKEPFGVGAHGGQGYQFSLYNNGIRQVLHVGGYGGIQTPISVQFYPDERWTGDWISERQQIRVESTVVPGAITSIVFSCIQTLANRCIVIQRPNPFSYEQGVGGAFFKAVTLGQTSD